MWQCHICKQGHRDAKWLDENGDYVPYDTQGSVEEA